MEKKIIVTWKKSAIGRTQKQKDTIRCLGFKKLNQTKSFNDNAVVRGMLKKVHHLIEVEASN